MVSPIIKLWLCEIMQTNHANVKFHSALRSEIFLVGRPVAWTIYEVSRFRSDRKEGAKKAEKGKKGEKAAHFAHYAFFAPFESFNVRPDFTNYVLALVGLWIIRSIA